MDLRTDEWVLGSSDRLYLTARAYIDVVNPGLGLGERISIGGSRTYPDLNAIEREIASYPSTTVILTGATYGTDAAVRAAAISHGLELRIYSPRFEHFPTKAAAYFARNQNIVDDADRLVSFWDGISTGTAQAIEYARSHQIPVSIRLPDIKASPVD